MYSTTISNRLPDYNKVANCCRYVDSNPHSFYREPVMKTLTVREVSDVVYAVFKEEAKADHRSLQEQVRWVLAKE